MRCNVVPAVAREASHTWRNCGCAPTLSEGGEGRGRWVYVFSDEPVPGVNYKKSKNHWLFINTEFEYGIRLCEPCARKLGLIW